jgi:signal recognition particle subunit SRP54
MGPLSGLMAMMPGIPKEVRDVEIGDKEIGRVEAIVRSMTTAERTNPDIIDTSRRTRIASGSGAQPTDVAQLLAQFKEMRKMMQQMGGGTAIKRIKKKNAKKKGKGGGRTTPKGSIAQPKQPYMLPGLDPLAAEMEKLGLDLPELK